MPDEPFFPGETGVPSVRYWCYLTLAINVIALAIGTTAVRTLAPLIFFGIFTLFGPINILMSWRSMVRQLNQKIEDVESNRTPMFAAFVPLRVNMSLEWLGIIVLAGCSAFLIIAIIASARLEPAASFRF
jgi:hypothetical protein